MTKIKLLPLVILAVSIVLAVATPWGGLVAWACPFCSAVQQTLSEEIKGADAALIVQLAKVPQRDPNAEASAIPIKATFSVVEALKGRELLGGKNEIEILFFGKQPLGTVFFVTGVDPKDVAWSTPTALSPKARDYITQVIKLPETGAKRLAFFQDYFEDADPLLAGDAYDEFAKAPYADVQALKDQMQRDKLLGWINDPVTSTSRRRLYLTMLGVCGTSADVPKLEAMIRNDDRQIRTSLDALIACYLNLRGPEGVPLVVDLFLKNTKAEYVDTYATIMALRFHGQEAQVIPKDALLAALRTMLDRPQLADLVIPDLARWEDWSAIDRLVTLFKEAKADSIWVRVPVINYLRACPLPEAKAKIEELAKIDPESVKRANQFFPFATNKPTPASSRPEDKKKDKSKGADETSPASSPSDKTEPAKAIAPAATSNKLSSLKTSLEATRLDAAALALGSEVLASSLVAETTAEGTPPTLDPAPQVATAAVPQPLSKVAARSQQHASEVEAPRASSWVLITYAGLSALGLSAFMATLFYSTAPSSRHTSPKTGG